MTDRLLVCISIFTSQTLKQKSPLVYKQICRSHFFVQEEHVSKAITHILQALFSERKLILSTWIYIYLYLETFKFCKTYKVRKKAKTRNRCDLIPHLTKDTILDSDKSTRKHHKQESQEVSPFPAGDHKAARNIQDSMANYKRIHKRSRSVRKLLEGFNMFDGTNLTLISDVGQDK